MKQKGFSFFYLLIIAATLGVATYFTITYLKMSGKLPQNIPFISAPTACTLEAKICPDGSAVGREGPNCEFAPCPTPR